MLTDNQPNVRYQRQITLPNDVQEVPQLNVFVDEVCEQADFDMSLVTAVPHLTLRPKPRSTPPCRPKREVSED